MSDNGDRTRRPVQSPQYQAPFRSPLKEPAFKMRVMLDLDFDLAMELGNFLIDARADNPALVALGRRLVGGD